MASELRVTTLKDASGNNSVGMSTVSNGTAKAWVKLNQAYGTATDSFNIASVSDDGTGIGSYTFTNSMNNDRYCLSAMGGRNDYIQSNTTRNDSTPDSTSGVSGLLNRNYNGTADDTLQMNSVVHGDLA